MNTEALGGRFSRRIPIVFIVHSGRALSARDNYAIYLSSRPALSPEG